MNAPAHDALADWPDFFGTLTQVLGLPLSEQQQTQWQTLYEKLIAANATMNLTRITALPDFLGRHALDGVSLVPMLRATFGDAASALDLGSGAGFPALPLAIHLPGWSWTAVEATQKKARFIQETAAALALNTMAVIGERAETVGANPAHRGRYDVVTARAVSALPALAELALPLLKKGGQLWAQKAESALTEELPRLQKALKQLGGGEVTVRPATLPALTGHVVVCLTKTGATPKDFPRRAGLAQTQPLA